MDQDPLQRLKFNAIKAFKSWVTDPSLENKEKWQEAWLKFNDAQTTVVSIKITEFKIKIKG